MREITTASEELRLRATSQDLGEVIDIIVENDCVQVKTSQDIFLEMDLDNARELIAIWDGRSSLNWFFDLTPLNFPAPVCSYASIPYKWMVYLNENI